LAFVLHVPEAESGSELEELVSLCQQCGEPWPCAHVALAYRLREAF
jgi:hypothetical protein